MTAQDRIFPPMLDIITAFGEYKKNNGGAMPTKTSVGYEPEGFTWEEIIPYVTELSEKGPVRDTPLAQGGTTQDTSGDTSKPNPLLNNGPLPPNNVIAAAMQNYRDHKGHTPNTYSEGYEPEGFTWKFIITELRKQRGLSPSDLMEQEGYPRTMKQVNDARKKLPQNSIIARAAINYRLENGTLPNGSSTGHEPEGFTWGQIMGGIREKQTKIKAILISEGYKQLLYKPGNSLEHPIHATDLFYLLDEEINRTGEIPFETGIFSHNVSTIRRAFLDGNVLDIDKVEAFLDFAPEDIPKIWEDFVLFSGLAVMDIEKHPVLLSHAEAIPTCFTEPA